MNILKHTDLVVYVFFFQVKKILFIYFSFLTIVTCLFYIVLLYLEMYLLNGNDLYTDDFYFDSFFIQPTVICFPSDNLMWEYFYYFYECNNKDLFLKNVYRDLFFVNSFDLYIDNVLVQLEYLKHYFFYLVNIKIYSNEFWYEIFVFLF